MQTEILRCRARIAPQPHLKPAPHAYPQTSQNKQVRFWRVRESLKYSGLNERSRGGGTKAMQNNKKSISPGPGQLLRRALPPPPSPPAPSLSSALSLPLVLEHRQNQNATCATSLLCLDGVSELINGQLMNSALQHFNALAAQL